MSAAELLDDRDPPEFGFRRWLKHVAAALAMIAVAGAGVVYFFPGEASTEAQRRQAMLELICVSQSKVHHSRLVAGRKTPVRPSCG